MDEVIVCKCGSHEWVIGTGGTRCAKCVWFLPEEWVKVDIDIVEINKRIEALKGE
jgi:hypothetical protein